MKYQVLVSLEKMKKYSRLWPAAVMIAMIKDIIVLLFLNTHYAGMFHVTRIPQTLWCPACPHTAIKVI